MFLVFKNPAPCGARDPCRLIFNRHTDTSVEGLSLNVGRFLNFQKYILE